MTMSINYFLRKQATQRYYIARNSSESARIDSSVSRVRRLLRLYFGNALLNAEPFGSYKRDTILPRSIDVNSDIDIMIVFNYAITGKTPETYRKWLVDFAYAKYPRSAVIKDFPTVVVDMNHIKLDLIPTATEENWGRQTIYIPNSRNDWQETDPHGFNFSLVEANKKYNFIVKPLIRLLKAWNCTNGYPYESFELEQIIAEMDFTNDNFETGFFWIVDHLPTNDLTVYGEGKVSTLRNNKDWIVEYLGRANMASADRCLRRIFP